MANTVFKQAGNLGFYDGWSPNYVYFKSILKYVYTQNSEKSYNGGWNTEFASQKAAEAMSDASFHSIPANMLTEEDSDVYFIDKFNKIINFLEQAITAEKESETAYIKQLLKDLKKSFKPAERKAITALQKLEKALKNGETNDKIEYDNINALINVLLQGFENTKTIMKYENDRVTQIQNMIQDIVKSRGNQAAGLGKAQRKSVAEQVEMAERAMERLERKIVVEYATTGQLTRVDEKTGQYVIFGGASLETKVPKAIDRVFATWTEEMIDKLTKDPEFVRSISRRLGKKYDVHSNNNFNLLENEVQEDIIQAIIQYGISDLSNILNKTISDEILANAKRKMNSRAKDNILDSVQNYNIQGLDPSFGRLEKQTALFKDAHTLAEIKEKNAIQLFSDIKKLIIEEKKLGKNANKKSASYLIQVMENGVGSNGENALTRTENIIAAIETIEKLQKEMNKATREWKKKVKEANDASLELSKSVKLASNNNATVTITVVNGQAEVELSPVIQMIMENSSFAMQKFNPKNLQSALNTLKSRASKILKQDIINCIQNTHFKIPEEELINHINKEMRSIKIKINGPTLAELLTGIYFRQTGTNIAIDWNRYAGKNDSFMITIQHNQFVRKFRSTEFYQSFVEYNQNAINAMSLIEEAQIKLAKEYQALVDKKVSSLTSSNDMQKYSKMTSIINEDVAKDEEDNEQYLKAQEELKEATENYIEIINGIAKDNKNNSTLDSNILNNIATEYLNTLQNAFHISNTVKSANDYVNQLGFKGGTLGSTLSDQLSRISDIFNSAGIPIPATDMMWLHSAIINCFPGSLVGEKNKNLIENYIGSLAAFALFDEGGAESKVIEQFQNDIIKAIKNGHAKKIIHLYVVDGMYIKGSTVLQRTLNTLKNEVIPNIQNIPKTMKRGAGVTIINSGSEADIKTNRPYKNHFDDANAMAWYITGQAVENKTKIQILFLAGLLDILNSINNSLSKVNMPAW